MSEMELKQIELLRLNQEFESKMRQKEVIPVLWLSCHFKSVCFQHDNDSEICKHKLWSIYHSTWF